MSSSKKTTLNIVGCIGRVFLGTSIDPSDKIMGGINYDIH